MRQLGITAYAALSVNIHMLAYEQAPRQPYACFLSQLRLCSFQVITQSSDKHKKVLLFFSASVRKQKKTVFGRFLRAVASFLEGGSNGFQPDRGRLLSGVSCWHEYAIKKITLRPRRPKPPRFRLTNKRRRYTAEKKVPTNLLTHF